LVVAFDVHAGSGGGGGASEAAFAKLWDNPDDGEYDRL